ncbi:unnamed protein product [Spirodela intermedia]|uniref:BZIP domain-containing protein n=1 Tax=Spirodela intermedia TaxID=51605 RepID=A0A7I8J6N8_SPIIN|nr:unnamed protein product [Spirodela intermedia]CAA6665908.1 unnamed protein product [Spirodela intermedia]
MGNGEAGTPSKTEKTSSSVQEQGGVQQYPDWAAMQAYYGPGIAMPPHYFGTTAVTSGHAAHHPYMWPMMPPFGTPYPAIYPHGGVYPHPSSSLVNEETKGPDGLPVSACNGRDKNEAGGGSQTRSQSTEDGTEGSSDGSDGNNENQNHGKPILEDSAAGKPVAIRTVPGPEIRVPSAAKAKISVPVPLSSNATPPGRDGGHSDLWVHDERELKRERRKQSNRESARRSRLRKQAETEELAEKVKALKAENMALKSEISRLSENSANLRQENSALMADQKAECPSDKVEPEAEASPRAGTENFLSKINNSNSTAGRSEQPDNETQENLGKLQQLLESKPKADAAIAG